mmetsp:Transcript_1110/g.2190  ORF Transcript_1110/g.2190 Transcript_1110/m.2190 type:complete len:267 (+) Transcript_1110:1015-1815(+)
MLDRVLDQFLKVALDFFETTNVVPRNVGYFNNRLTQTGWIRLSKGMTEMILVDRHTVQNFGINLFVFNINEIHLFTNALHGSFSTKSSNISSDKTMSLTSNRFGFNILIELHVTGMDTENFQTSIFIRNSNVNFAIESTETAKGGINGIGTIGSSNDHNRCTLLESVHECQHLGDNTTFDFSIGLFTLWGNGINLINKDNGWGILFGFFESLAEVGFRFSGHFGHDFWPINQKEKGSRFIGHCSGNQRFSRTGWSIQQDTTRWLDS